uniref:DNA repair protein RecO n=1 Tax=Candidatus Kentrum sp. TUN TaxID=2126343 RepID=A0A450ZEC0_9GAMM|nr:MAG: DNA replication and repair protein RecO [Candidatus Kentron sp. TUN]VFK52133.1 MAG: DNA replication and repair protein RecO [Candidatus Kentron sp. TUN]VFK52176.1 MAG: DNA replication and repair protein RecO [Candidatus Kentron sp. TUN]
MGRQNIYVNGSYQPEFERAFVLNRRPYRETSLLVEAFTSESGRIGLVAKGARRGRVPLSTILQPFRPLLLSWRGSRELFTLTLAEQDDSIRSLHVPPVKSGFYVNELLLRLLHRHDPHPILFKNYYEVLTKIAIPEQEESALRIFEKRLLAAIGYGLSLDQEAKTKRPIENEKIYRYQKNQGFIEHDSVLDSSDTVHGSTLAAIAQEALHEPKHLREAKHLMRYILRGYLGQKPLASRMLYRCVTRTSEATSQTFDA